MQHQCDFFKNKDRMFYALYKSVVQDFKRYLYNQNISHNLFKIVRYQRMTNLYADLQQYYFNFLKQKLQGAYAQ